MYIFISFLSFFILLVQNVSVLGKVHLRIADGSNAAKGEFPFQVSFQKKSNNVHKHFCGGTIVQEKFVLTAAHCVPGSDFTNTRIVAGITNLKETTKTENLRNIDDVFKHPSYNRPLPKENDIALVKVDTPFMFNKFISKVSLASPTYQIPVGQKVHVTGWGLKKASGTAPTGKLKKTTVIVLKHDQCVKKYDGILKVESTIFCTNHNNVLSNRGVCNGDSGGPVVVNKNTLVGVIKGSFHGSPLHPIRPECGSKKYPDMYSDVSKYRDWIDKTIATNAA